MRLPPYTVAKYGLYGAVAIAVVSAWLGLQAGATLDYAVLRGVIVFVIFAVLAFAAEAVLMASSAGTPSTPATPQGRKRDIGDRPDREPASE